MQLQNQLEFAVKALCPDIAKSAEKASSRKQSEKALWKEILICVLSSQVRNEVAQVAANAIVESTQLWTLKTEKIEREIREILVKPLNVNGNFVRYRFPNVKAAQIANAINRINYLDISIRDIVYSNDSANDIRSILVDKIPGLGYKQSSMFLRNIGRAYDLAILDTHIIDYMNLLKIEKEMDRAVLTKRKYLITEQKLKSYADNLGYAVGYVDWAIWIVMRTAKQERYV